MQTILIVNGEPDWSDYFPGYHVQQRKIQSCSWVYHQQELRVIGATGGLRVDAVLWRVGAIAPQPAHRHALDLIRMAGVPCLNPTSVLLRGYDRLSMLNELREAGLPVQSMSVALGERMLELVDPDFPAVLKVGNLHGGFGKMRVENEEQWTEARDLISLIAEYVTVEPYINYVRDIRCLAVDKQIWAMARRGAGWRANSRTQSHQLIVPPPQLASWTYQAMAHLGTEVLALDFLEKPDGMFVLLESNDVPGFSGFPATVRNAVAELLCRKLEERR
jgi:ribosomal protein S6--L-glutamate ligase